MLLKKTQQTALATIALSALLMTALSGCQKEEATPAPEAAQPAQTAPAPAASPEAAPPAAAPEVQAGTPAEQPKS